MQIVLNADDFGASADTVRSTIDCFERDVLTSATTMPSMPDTAAALAFARGRPELDFGVHLTLVRDEESRSLCDARELPGLADEEGRFLPTRTFRLRALAGRLPVAALEREIAAQIAYVRDHGVPVTHVDSHRHVHKLPAVREALARVLPRFGIERVRAVQDVYLRRPLASPTVWLGHSWGRGLRRRFRTTAHLYMPTSAADTAWEAPLLAALARLDGGSLEVGVHPGSDEPWRSAERDSAIAFAELARGRRHELVPWSAI
jgi:predicted glycoside hydrolase/deacetylase ChbG (UPF0249 family)